MPATKWIILDTETTGLSVKENVILEIGIMLCDAQLNVIETTCMTVDDDAIKGHLKHLEWLAQDAANQPVPLQEPWSGAKYVYGMHKDNGLFDEIMNSPGSNTYEIVQANMIQFLRDHGAGQGKHPLVGSTINFDRGFLEGHMPGLLAEFHYRNVDVSGIDILTKTYLPDVATKLSETVEVQKKHRVLDDCEDTRKYLEFYLNEVFLKGA